MANPKHTNDHIYAMTFNTSPTQGDLDEIKIWLKKEEEVSKSGFYCNWSTIERSFEKQRLILFQLDDHIIGFICWSNYNLPYAEIEIMEIHPDFRSKGHGSQFYKIAEDHFRKKGFIAIKLFCSPSESEGFWKAMNFVKFPFRGYSESPLTYFRPLITTNPAVDDTDGNMLELWNLEPYEIKTQKANWVWKIGPGTAPILQPANADWNLRLTKNGIILKEDKIKYFDDFDEVFFAPFLFIDTNKYFGQS